MLEHVNIYRNLFAIEDAVAYSVTGAFRSSDHHHRKQSRGVDPDSDRSRLVLSLDRSWYAGAHPYQSLASVPRG